MTPHEKIAGMRKSLNRFTVMFLALLTVVWLAAIIDRSFDLGWGYDAQTIWAAPLMALFAIVLRMFGIAIFRFVEGNF